jgi:hypothetical protein
MDKCLALRKFPLDCVKDKPTSFLHFLHFLKGSGGNFQEVGLGKVVLGKSGVELDNLFDSVIGSNVQSEL